MTVNSENSTLFHKKDAAELLKERFSAKKCTVLGIGVSNLPLIRLLCEAGAKVEARDKRSPEALGAAVEELRTLGVSLRTGEDYLSSIEADYIFRSPGIRPDLPGIPEAAARGAVLLSEMELFFELCPCPIIGITGSDGKTTTTTLISLLLKASGQWNRVFLGGNIGQPLLPQLGEMDENDIAVAELSSFQLFTMRRPSTVAVITNLSPNHLDWHRDMEEYIDAKKNCFRGDANKAVVLNAENAGTAAIAEDLKKTCPEKQVLLFSSQNNADLCLQGGYICLNGEAFLKTDDILLPGRHNLENYMAAIAAVNAAAAVKGNSLGKSPLSKEAALSVASTFPGVEHRMEFVREKNGVRYYNSSIDSSPSRTAAALSTFGDSKKVTVICGGYDKHIPFAPLAKALIAHAGRVVLTGATADAIFTALNEENAAEKPQIYKEASFDDAVKLAASLARPGDAVLLSPGCASFDAFPNFMARGERFKELVRAL